jgi:hypothetical protein
MSAPDGSAACQQPRPQPCRSIGTISPPEIVQIPDHLGRICQPNLRTLQIGQKGRYREDRPVPRYADDDVPIVPALRRPQGGPAETRPTGPVRRRSALAPALPSLSAVISTVTGVSDRKRELYRFELEPEVRDWLGSLSDSDFKRVDEVCGMLAEKGAGLGGPWSDHLEGPVWELRVRLHEVAARVTYWCRPDGAIVFLTVFRKVRQHDQRQIERAVRAQQACERDHRGPAAKTYERQA